jgi:hypothetical protein
MTTLTIEIDEPTLRRLEERARRQGQSASDVIRQALDSAVSVSLDAGRREHFLNVPPLKLGKMLMPLGSRHEWYDEMLNREEDD